MVLFKHRSRATAVIDGPESPAEAWRALEARTFGWEDALLVAKGERVVRAILAHHAIPTLSSIWPDLDLEYYLEGYRSAPGSKPPLDQRRASSDADYDGPRRRATDALIELYAS